VLDEKIINSCDGFSSYVEDEASGKNVKHEDWRKR
jgi:hypothetical protein